MDEGVTVRTALDLILKTDALLKTPKISSISKQFHSNALLSYMSYQMLDSYLPEIHWRVSQEDFMRKQNGDFNLIEYRLTDPEIEAFEAWLQREPITFAQALNYCGDKDLKTSFTFSEDKANWCVSLTGREGNRFNSGATLTTWSDDPVEAFFMAIYKASVIFADGKWQTRKSSNRG